MRLLAVLVMMAGLAPPAMAQDWQVLGLGRLFSNDRLGDGDDRWRSGSTTLSVVQGRAGTLALPDRIGRLLDFRLQTAIIAPSPTGPLDRPYAGIVALGLYSHNAFGPTEFTLGADLVLVGPQTGVAAFQAGFHDAFSLPAPRGTASQLGNAVHAGGSAQLVWPLRLADRLTLRPFVQVQAGAEDLFRAGADLLIGPAGSQPLWLRDPTTGHLYPGLAGTATAGLSLLLGADAAQINNSAYLPENLGYLAESERTRARLGLQWQSASGAGLFYGLTWLSPEFRGQPEGQVLGSLRLDFNF